MSKTLKLILTDIDGVWTDGGMYYDEMGNEWKKFHTYDGGGVSLAHQYNILVGIITGETTKIVERRAQKLKVDFVYQGIKDKLSVAEKLCANLSITLENVAYMGDDLGDKELLMKAGWSAIPMGAYLQGKINPTYITKLRGGEGAFREFVEYLLMTAEMVES